MCLRAGNGGFRPVSAFGRDEDVVYVESALIRLVRKVPVQDVYVHLCRLGTRPCAIVEIGPVEFNAGPPVLHRQPVQRLQQRLIVVDLIIFSWFKDLCDK